MSLHSTQAHDPPTAFESAQASAWSKSHVTVSSTRSQEEQKKEEVQGARVVQTNDNDW